MATNIRRNILGIRGSIKWRSIWIIDGRNGRTGCRWIDRDIKIWMDCTGREPSSEGNRLSFTDAQEMSCEVLNFAVEGARIGGLILGRYKLEFRMAYT